jgi:pimeloyl-ACP methyl ester carboxylesterase|tara:strand:- start:7719 stop:8654 length:936 start_codon:yes stop_codon:yes gene_type:complete
MNRQATFSGTVVFILLITAVFFLLYSKWTVIIGILLVLLTLHQLLTMALFRSPSKRRSPLEHPDWKIMQTKRDGFEIFGQINLVEGKNPLIIFLHGWESSSIRFLERMQIFQSKNCHTLILESRSHGLAPSTKEWTARKITLDLDTLLDEVDQSLVSSVHIYGHSMGGFIALGLQHERCQGWWKDKLSTVMLESPMTAYSFVLKKLLGPLAFTMPLMKSLSVSAIKKIHPELINPNFSDFDTPNWGLPNIPTLVLQAADDHLLGREHYDLLMKHLDVEHEAHIIQTLHHSQNQVDTERDELIMQWIEKRIV